MSDECQHHVYGVGTFAVEQVLEGERIVAEAARAAVNLLKVGTPLPS
jgi:hypothetical protein